MNLAKSLDVFSPHDVKGRIHIIGCGSVGSTIAELLARYGLTNFTLYDFDKVEKKNIVNQMFFDPQVGQPKVEALRDILCAINPEAKNDIRLEPTGWNGQPLSGYVFLAVDNIEIRQKSWMPTALTPSLKPCLMSAPPSLMPNSTPPIGRTPNRSRNSAPQ